MAYMGEMGPKSARVTDYFAGKIDESVGLHAHAYTYTCT